MTPAECIAEFERRSAARDFDLVAELVAADATFFFNDGSYRGLNAIRRAVEATWAYNPEQEVYAIEDVSWVASDDGVAACVYRFRWEACLTAARSVPWGAGPRCSDATGRLADRARTPQCGPGPQGRLSAAGLTPRPTLVR